MIHRRLLLSTLPALLLAACGGGGSGNGGKGDGATLTVAATAVPHAEILAQVKPVLAKEGVDLDVRVFNDYVQPNLQVDQGQIDVNFFETKPYLDQFNRERGTKLVPIAGVHVEPLGAYSRRWKTLAQLPQGASVAIPNEPSNGGRALQLLQKAGLIRLRNPADPLATIRDVASNPKALQFRELEAATLPRVLGEVDLAMINTNYALDAKLNPVRDALAIEDKDSPYVNYLVGRPGSADDPRVRKLVAALRSPATKAFIETTYKGAVLPAF
ncbi:MetQ/NlpA family ABC transporter substrate-binding protein [Sphingomonas sp. BK069]|uniref:MetQ/NlpA family ABC transporter substrate-binding protein n=1 Tax=Sphingomonas sp. BK069 TaxID=2586979 RepID=UPI001614A517|nr:MetQ/NlpA family ABC transporter substrate-binding protein [Sphingomonas sp. BK069]MBB3347842.1 D-methionine transport system substrate-binding protein [Sphingomonas sp. BK069]